MTVNDRDWMLAAAGNEALAEELRTGRCRCGSLLREESVGCRWHEAGRRRIGEVLSEAMVRKVWDGASGESGGGGGGRLEDMELLGRYLPPRFLAAYEVLIFRGIVLSQGSLRGGRGYDESVLTSSGRRTGGLGAPRSGEPELRLVADQAKKRGSSEGAVIRDEEAVEMRRRIDRKLRRMTREIVLYLELAGTGKDGRKNLETRRCSGKGCKKFADEEWKFCPSCGSEIVVERRARRGQRA